MSTLSVEISSSGSSAATDSPTCFSQRLTVPSVTLSPRAGKVTSVPEPPAEPPFAAPPSDPLLCAVAGSASSAFCSSTSEEGSGSGSDSGSGSGSGSLSAAASSAPPADPPPEASLSSPMTARTAPTSTVSSSAALISSTTPAAGEGISVSTLSVEISSKGSSASTVSPTCFNHRLTVPSVTLSPSAGRVTSVDMALETPFSWRLAARFGLSLTWRTSPPCRPRFLRARRERRQSRRRGAGATQRSAPA